MSNFDDLNKVKASLIRKAQGGFILTAPMDVEVPEKVMMSPTEFVDFASTGYDPLGYLSKSDGITFGREVETSETESFGVQEPTRIDITSDATSASFVCQETNKTVLELYHGVDLDGATVDENGELVFENEKTPAMVYRRFIYVSKDGNGDDAIYITKVMPRGALIDPQEQSWSNEDALAYGMSVNATRDEELGFAVRHHFSGPGFQKILANMGFAEAEPVNP